MVPSSFMISQITPAGVRPAMRARSTEASVCPARTSTPPSRARSGNTWPGRARSPGRQSGSIACRMVRVRSAAEMPVVTPSRASIDSQKAVPKFEVLRGTHQRQTQVVAALRRQRQADQSAAVRRHEVDDLGRDFFGGNGEIAFILAVLIVHHDQDAPGADLLDGFGD